LLLCAVSLLISLFYIAIVFHIIGSTKRTREAHTVDRRDLSTHPDLTHHDLSSIFLEGLPPLRKSSASQEASFNTEGKQDLVDAEAEEELYGEALPITTASGRHQEKTISTSKSKKYLRQRKVDELVMMTFY
jgi:hypothetical protein